jgi:hypothetical protein
MTEKVSITIKTTTLTLDRTADVCVVYVGTVGEAESVHDAPVGFMGPEGVEPIMFEPGGSLVNAGLLADHLAKPHAALAAMIEAGAFTLFESAVDALKMPTAQLTAMIRVTRNPRALRAWIAAEETREPKRLRILEGLRERLRINATHSTPTVSLAHLATATHTATQAAAASAEKRRKAG